MKLQIAELKTERQWRAATGFDQARFEKLLALGATSYLILYGKSLTDRQADIKVTPKLNVRSRTVVLYIVQPEIRLDL